VWKKHIFDFFEKATWPQMKTNENGSGKLAQLVMPTLWTIESEFLAGNRASCLFAAKNSRKSL
jgi:hypothetical protein